MPRSTFVYVTYIRTTPEQLWAALTDEEFIRQYCSVCAATASGQRDPHGSWCPLTVKCWTPARLSRPSRHGG